ncbi:MAG: DUF192 domain-containing protein [Deltaproteobacteria bacterium]|nr:MAG: DUF192 domain-containing protein [Deltaproteobacteria bacterium]
MKSFITQSGTKLIKNILLGGTFLLLACNSGQQHNSSSKTEEAAAQDPFAEVREIKLAMPSGKVIDTKLAITSAEQTKGLSGTKSQDFGPYDGLLFFYLQDDLKGFWMPDTYFDLAIIFLDSDFKVVGYEIAPHHPGMTEPPQIYRTKSYLCRHVLEIRADSPLVAELQKGMELKLISKIPLSKIESKIRLSR